MKKILIPIIVFMLFISIVGCNRKCSCLPELSGIFACNEETRIWDDSSFSLFELFAFHDLFVQVFSQPVIDTERLNNILERDKGAAIS